MQNIYFIIGGLFWGAIIFVLYFLRKTSLVHNISIEIINEKLYILVLPLLSIILICIIPMGLCPTWNGKIPDHRNQYERMTESILEGRLYIDYGDMDPRLLEMENPYDPIMRNETGVIYHYDHALYNGHYYMYFGIAPVFLVFLPYRLLTGTSLPTYHATQIFVSLFIVGVFVLFYFLAKRFFNKLTLGMYLSLSTAFAVMSIWYSIDAPALYCTAITAGLCMEIWSIYFFVKAVWGGLNSKQSIFYAFLGCLFGALTFGCRPSIALANILAIPMLIEYLRNRKANLNLMKELFLTVSPYIIVAALLMTYNYMRFDNPFEFGQTWQLTSADQSNYGNILSQFNLVKILNGILQNFISYTPLKNEFPYISFNGAFISFPILLFSFIGLVRKEVITGLKEVHLWNFVVILFFTPVLITVVSVMETPWLLERYRMDIYWLMGLLCYIIIGFYYTNVAGNSNDKFSHRISIWAVITIFTCFLLYLVPWDYNLTEYAPEILEKIRRVLMFGLK